MPAAAGRRSGDATPARAGSSWLTTPLRSRTARGAPTPARGTPVSVQEDCCICVVDLATKRAVSLLPCRHRFHESCATTWLETRENRAGQTCPLCRTRVTAVREEESGGGGTACLPFPLGATGEPLQTYLSTYPQPATLQSILAATDARLARCEELAKKEGRGAEFRDDVQSELRKLRPRRATIVRMLEEVGRGEWESRQEALLRNLEERMAAVRLLQAQMQPGEERIAIFRPNQRAPTVLVTQPPAAPAARPQQPRADDWSQARPTTVAEPFRAGRPTAASQARAAAAAATRAALAAARTAAAAAPSRGEQRPQRLLPTGRPLLPARPRQSLATGAARPQQPRAVVWSPERPNTQLRWPLVFSPRPPRQQQPQPAADPRNVRAQQRQSAVVRASPPRLITVEVVRPQQQPQPAVRAAPPHLITVQVVRPQPALAAAAARRVTFTVAGPARRRRSRLSALSSTPAPARRRRSGGGQQEEQQAAHATVESDNDMDISIEEAAPQPNWNETPRRSERLAAAAARRRLESGDH